MYLYGSPKKPQILDYTSSNDSFLITEVESVYCAVRTECLYTAYYVSSLKGYSDCSVAARERERERESCQ